MGADSKIEWCHATFNPWRGCTKVSEGCKFCYAETLSARNPAILGTWGPKGERVIAAESYWNEPLRWNKAAQAEGVRRRVFCASLADVFEGRETMPADAWEAVQEARKRLFALAYQTKWLDWLFLTKRPENIQSILSTLPHPAYPHTDWWTLLQRQPRPNWWFGTSVENQETADLRIPHLLQVPAAVRFLSMEPLLGAVDISRWFAVQSLQQSGVWQSTCALHWIIAGGESGPHARPSHPDWFRSLRDQCQAAGVPFHFKQWGEWLPVYPYTKAGDSHFRSDGVITGKVVGVDSESFMPKEPNAFGWIDTHIPGGMETQHAVPQDDRIGMECWMRRVGKKNAGRLLDGRTWDQFPTSKGVE